MAKFRRRPEFVEAEKWIPGDIEQARRLGISQYHSVSGISASMSGGSIRLFDGCWIVNSDDGMKALANHWFRLLYEPVPENVVTESRGE